MFGLAVGVYNARKLMGHLISKMYFVRRDGLKSSISSKATLKNDHKIGATKSQDGADILE